MRVEKQIDEQPLDGRPVVVELVMPDLADLARVLKTVQRRFARKLPVGFPSTAVRAGSKRS